MVSMKDIAAACGVSVATVSKALNNPSSDISLQTRDRIRKVAAEMGYLTNAAARALKTNRTNDLGVLFVDNRNSGLAHEYFSSVLDSFRVAAESAGYDITFINNHNVGGTSTTYLSHCRYRGVDGVAIMCADFTSPEVFELVHSDLPVVTIDHVFNDRMSIISDNVIGIDALVRYIHSFGHTRIAFIHGEMTSVTRNRLTSFYHTCSELGLEIPDTYVRESTYHDPAKCGAITRELMALPEPPTCILFPDDFSAIGGLNVLNELGIKVPDDVSVTGYDGIYLSRVLRPSLVTYHQNTQALGQMAANKLIELIEHPKTTIPGLFTVQGELICGESLKAPKQ